MGLIKDLAEAATRQHTPKIAFVAPPAAYVASSGKRVEAGDVDVLVRALSMGKLHHAMMATCAVAIATAASVPGTLVNLAAGGGSREAVRFGHPSGSLRVGALAERRDHRHRNRRTGRAGACRRRLLDEGATVPFIARYRKEVTGGLDDTQLRTLEERLGYLRELEDRRARGPRQHRGTGQADRRTAREIDAADTKARLEDLYLPYKPKRRTKAQIAREAGLEPLADGLLADPTRRRGFRARFIDADKGVADARPRWKARARS
jgi:hypothetical protein